jgi:hypothetical protein
VRLQEGEDVEQLEPTIEHVNLTARPGELIAIIGPVGSGKVNVPLDCVPLLQLLWLPGFLKNTPRGVLLKVAFFDLHMSAKNMPRGVFSRIRQTTGYFLNTTRGKIC